MPRFSAFAGFGHYCFSSRKPRAQRFYASMVNALGNGDNYSLNFDDNHQSARLYATAIQMARASHTLQRAANNRIPLKTTEMLPVLEPEYGLVPGPTATLQERRAALAVRKEYTRGARREAVEGALRLILGDSFVAFYVGDPGVELLADGDMEASGTTAWTALLGATLTKDTTLPLGGTQALRITNPSALGSAEQSSLITVGEHYLLTGAAHGDGTAIPFFSDGVTTHWTGTTSTAWQPVSVHFTAEGTDAQFGKMASGNYVEWDQLALRPYPGYPSYDDISSSPGSFKLPTTPIKLRTLDTGVSYGLGSPQWVDTTYFGADTDELLPGETITVEPGRLGLIETVEVEAVSGTQIQCTFNIAHPAGSYITTAPYPLNTSLARHVLAVITAVDATNAEYRRQVREYLDRAMRGVTTYSIAEETSTGVSGPFTVGGGLIGITPIGAITL